MNVDDMVGTDLDYWVARANGLNPEIVGSEVRVDRVRLGYLDGSGPCQVFRGRYSPSTRWDEAGSIIEREGICISPHGPGKTWGAWITSSCYESNSPDALGDTPLVAAMRAYVVAKFGREVSL
jgi:hypothetical protein